MPHITAEVNGRHTPAPQTPQPGSDKGDTLAPVRAALLAAVPADAPMRRIAEVASGFAQALGIGLDARARDLLALEVFHALRKPPDPKVSAQTLPAPDPKVSAVTPPPGQSVCGAPQSVCQGLLRTLKTVNDFQGVTRGGEAAKAPPSPPSPPKEEEQNQEQKTKSRRPCVTLMEFIEDAIMIQHESDVSDDWLDGDTDRTFDLTPLFAFTRRVKACAELIGLDGPAAFRRVEKEMKKHHDVPKGEDPWSVLLGIEGDTAEVEFLDLWDVIRCPDAGPIFVAATRRAGKRPLVLLPETKARRAKKYVQFLSTVVYAQVMAGGRPIALAQEYLGKFLFGDINAQAAQRNVSRLIQAGVEDGYLFKVKDAVMSKTPGRGKAAEYLVNAKCWPFLHPEIDDDLRDRLNRTPWKRSEAA